MSRFTLSCSLTVRWTTVALYTTKLANNIELKSDSGVGLLEVSSPLQLVNIVEEICYYIIYVNR